MTQDDMLAAFRPEWERLGAVAQRLGKRSGQQIVKPAQQLRDAGSVESRFNGSCLEWRLVPTAMAADDMAVPQKVTPYCVPPELEGPDNGLVEQVAERLWRKAKEFSPTGKGLSDNGWEDRPEKVKQAWREVAYDALLMMFDIGFVGPAGHPDPERFDRMTYGWNYEANNWEILDGEGGYVALVADPTDVELIMAAPKMMTAINALLGAIPPGHPAREMEELLELELSLPEHRESKEKNDVRQDV